ncbi:MAG: tryptophan synthase subunit alpha [Ignavibacteriaceae bacterium]
MKQSKIENCIQKVNDAGSKVLSVFLTCGFPNKEGFEELALSVLGAGADMIELGVPFSDPMADGSVIQYSSQKALDNGISLEKTLKIASNIKSKTNKPIILMGYANPFLNFGITELSKAIKQIGVDGIIVPDVPVEEYDNFFENKFDDIDTIMLVSPTSTKERVIGIGKKSSGFVYCVSVKGITGKKNSFEQSSLDYVSATKNILGNKKVLVGFGISNEETAQNFSNVSDGVIIGSAVINLLKNSNGTYKETLDFISKIKKTIS